MCATRRVYVKMIWAGPTRTCNGADMRDRDDEPAEAPAAVRVRTVYRERWRRVLILSGEVDATLTYNGMGNGERVYLNGRLWAETSIWTWKTVYPFAEFDLPGRDDDIPARIDVAASFLPWKFGITRFRLTVDGIVLYDEKRGDVWFRDGRGRVTDEPYEEDL
jgi:hypothetical protein